MSVFFADTSSIAKRYISEPGSEWVRSWSRPKSDNIVVVSALTTVEMASLMARRVREGSLSASDESELWMAFKKDISDHYLTIALDNPLLALARRYARTHGLRALDSIHLASASDARESLATAITFICGDNKLLAAATAEGFSTDNPYLHV